MNQYKPGQKSEDFRVSLISLLNEFPEKNTIPPVPRLLEMTTSLVIRSFVILLCAVKTPIPG